MTTPLEYLSKAFLPREPIRIAGQRPLAGRAALLLRWFAVAVIFYHLSAAQFGAPEVMKFRPAHLAMYVSMIYLAYGWRRGDKRTGVPWWDWVLFALAWVPLVHIYWNYEYVVNRYPYITPLSTMDIVAALIAVVLTLEACRRTVGVTLVALLGIFVAHALFGPYFPAPCATTAKSAFLSRPRAAGRPDP